MSILNQAKKLAAESKRIAKENKIKENKKRADQDHLVQSTRESTMKLLNNEINGKHGFKVVPDKDDWYGKLATITHKGDWVGSVYVAMASYKFRGSDESPEVEIPACQITLRTSNDIRTTLAASMDGIEKFSESLAEYLKVYF